MSTQVQEYGVYRGMVHSFSEEHSVIPGTNDTENADLIALAVSKRFWEDTGRAASIVAGLEALSGSTPVTRELSEATDRFWDGTLVGLKIVNHAVMVEAE